MGHSYKTVSLAGSLSYHPNYKQKEPIDGESQIAFALRSAAHLLSPPQEAGESNELECIDVAVQILNLQDSLEAIWKGQFCWCDAGPAHSKTDPHRKGVEGCKWTKVGQKMIDRRA